MSAVRGMVIGLAVVLVGASAWAQDGHQLDQLRSIELSGSRGRELQGLGMRPGALSEAGEFAVEGIIDPAGYRVAPGDLLALAIWGATDVILDLQVASDGSLVIPSVGSLDLGGRTLAEAADHVRQACAGAYPEADISLTLTRPGLLRIAATGMLALPGVYAIYSTYRLSDLLELAGGLLDGADTRRIAVSSAAGATRSCDILAWMAGDERGDNPRLSAGDRVHVPAAAGSYRVRGAFPVAEDELAPRSSLIDRPFEPQSRQIAARHGDTLAFVLLATRGIGVHTCQDSITVRGTEGNLSRVALSDAGRRTVAAGETIEIPFCQEWIAVGGSVSRPGLYPFLPGATVADYVYAAGGPNEYGRHGGWKITVPGDKKRRGADATDLVAAGSLIYVPERRAHTISTLLTPLGSAVAVVVSILALTR